MAQRVQVLLVDDLDGTQADQTVTFALDGVTYEIDLTDANAASLREALEPWAGAARRTSGRAARGTGKTVRANNGETAKIREWAKEQGYQVSDRGRVSAEIRQAYKDAN
jgi:hypothetical protein